MTPLTILAHHDRCAPWAAHAGQAQGLSLASAYQVAMAVRALRVARGEVPCGYKVGFANWERWAGYDNLQPYWGSMWRATSSFCDGHGEMSLAGACQPRIAPVVVFGLCSAPRAGASVHALCDAIAWVACGLEVVQSHVPDWKLAVVGAVVDQGLHASLLVGHKVQAPSLAADAGALHDLLMQCQVTLKCFGRVVNQSLGVTVLGGPLRALQYLNDELHHGASAPALQGGDMVCTGAWSVAWPAHRGQRWTCEFTYPLFDLTADLR